ncbi:MAG: DUF2213 domain-containing protein, partial [Cyanobacteria bacterium J06648_11]
VPFEVLFNKDSLETLKGIPITREHPLGGVNADNARQHARGSTHNLIVQDGDFLGVAASIFDRELIREIEDGVRRGNSPGYRARKESLEAGRLRQTYRDYNHDAIVQTPRAGPDNGLYYDSADADAWWAQNFDSEFVDRLLIGELQSDTGQIARQPTIDLRTQTVPVPIQLDGRIYQVDGDDAPALRDAIATMQTDFNADAAETSSALEQAVVALESADADLTDLEARNLELETELAEANIRSGNTDAIATECAQRMAAWNEVLPAVRIFNADAQPDWNLSVPQIRKLYLGARNPDIRPQLDSADDSTVEGMWLLTARDRAAAADGSQQDSTSSLWSMLNDSDGGYQADMGMGMGYGRDKNPLTKRRKKRGLPGVSLAPAKEA